MMDESSIIISGVLQNADQAYLGKKEIGKRISEKNDRPDPHFAKLR